jgi:hypothetical protein
VPVRLVAASGDTLVAELDSVRVRIPDTALATRPTVGHRVLVEAGCVRPRLSPGHLLVDGSRGNGLADGPVLRVYVHLTITDAAVASWRWTLRCLERLGVPYRAKILSAGSALPRRDALVVYLGPDAWAAAGVIAAGLPDRCGREVSPFTHQFAPGVSVAWEPEDDRIGQRGLSFGLHRALAVATGLIKHATGAVADRADAVSSALIDAGIDPVRPFRNTNSPPLPTT